MVISNKSLFPTMYNLPMLLQPFSNERWERKGAYRPSRILQKCIYSTSNGKRDHLYTYYGLHLEYSRAVFKTPTTLIACVHHHLFLHFVKMVSFFIKQHGGWKAQLLGTVTSGIRFLN